MIVLLYAHLYIVLIIKIACLFVSVHIESLRHHKYMFLLGRSYNPKLKLYTRSERLFYTNASVLRTETTLLIGYYAKNSFLHSLIHAQLTYLVSFSSMAWLLYTVSERLLMASSMMALGFIIFSHTGNS